MVKKISMALLCTVLGSSLYAGNYDSDSKGFLGLEVGAATVQGDRFFGTGLNAGYEGDAVEYGFRIGAQTNEWRAMFVFDYYDSSDDDQNLEKSFLMVDYFFLESDSDVNFRPFIGANVGYVNYESTFVESSDFAYGGQIGFAVEVAEVMDVDLSYRYSLSNSEQLDNMGSIVLGINYLY